MEHRNLAAPTENRGVRRVGLKTIPALKTAYLEHELNTPNPRRQKVALQELASHYRRRTQLGPADRYKFEVHINGLIAVSSDIKVVRWGLNCLAQMGTMAHSNTPVGITLRRYEQYPEIVAAAVAALSKMYNGNLAACPVLGTVDPLVKTLAAMQNTDHAKLDLSGLKIDISKVDAEVLKLALITVGLNRSVENMFHPAYRNGELVKVLGEHPDPIVRQYCVWSVIENPTILITDLGVPFGSLEQQPPNVQSKLLQLGAKQIKDPIERQDLIRNGTYLPHPDAREGLAKGVLDIYYDGLDEVTIGWFDSEANSGVREILAEHFAKQARVSGTYHDKAIEIYDTDTTLRQRLLVGSEGTRLHSILQGSSSSQGTSLLVGFEEDLLGLIIDDKKRKVQLKVLMMMASPMKQTHLRLDQEARDMAHELAMVSGAAQQVEVVYAHAVRIKDIQGSILNAKPKVLHFSGHGSPGSLCFENDQGTAQNLEADDFAEFLSYLKGVECVVLNACFSDSVAKGAAKHLKAVVGCDVSIGDDAAISFTKAFYRALAHGETYANAFGLAVNDLNMAGYRGEAAKYKFTVGSA